MDSMYPSPLSFAATSPPIVTDNSCITHIMKLMLFSCTDPFKRSALNKMTPIPVTDRVSRIPVIHAEAL